MFISRFAKEKACIALPKNFIVVTDFPPIKRPGISSLLEICLAGTLTSQAIAAED
ncbi:hypothetical protein OROHE_009495 [Orobanche hederae]